MATSSIRRGWLLAAGLPWMMSLCLVVILLPQAAHGMNDYWNMFCGKGNDCYEILGLTRVSNKYLISCVMVVLVVPKARMVMTIQ